GQLLDLLILRLLLRGLRELHLPHVSFGRVDQEQLVGRIGLLKLRGNLSRVAALSACLAARLRLVRLPLTGLTWVRRVGGALLRHSARQNQKTSSRHHCERSRRQIPSYRGPLGHGIRPFRAGLLL